MPAPRPRIGYRGPSRRQLLASTGVAINAIEVSGETIRIRTQNAQRIVALADFGLRLDAVDGESMDFHLRNYLPVHYVRFECWGSGENMAWTQPFFVG